MGTNQLLGTDPVAAIPALSRMIAKSKEAAVPRRFGMASRGHALTGPLTRCQYSCQKE
jgi:hypothetical protein